MRLPGSETERQECADGTDDGKQTELRALTR